MVRRLVVVVALAAVACGRSTPSPQPPVTAAQPNPHRSAVRTDLFRPQDLGVLEGPDRAEWQQPERVMDALGIADGAKVADLGAGGGWFTVWLARRVGPNGVVYAEDIQREMIESIQRRVQREGLQNVQFVLGASDDPLLPENTLQAVLAVDLYYYLQAGEPVALLRNVGKALTPSGRLGIVDFKLVGLGPEPPPDKYKRVDPEVVIRDATAAGLKLISRETFLRYQYLLVFGK